MGSRISRDDLVQHAGEGRTFDSSSSDDVSSERKLASLDGDSIKQGGNGDQENEGDAMESEHDEELSLVENGANGSGFESWDDNGSGSDNTENEVAMKGMDSISETGSSTSTDSRSPNQSPRAPANDRAALREMMAESQKSVVATISAATQADIAKGKAIQQQRSAFDALLNTRIRLQKSLVAANSLPRDPNSHPELVTKHDSSIRTAETAALALWTRLEALRQSLDPIPSSDPQKRPFSATLTTATSSLWTHMQTNGSVSLSRHRAVLSKWSTKLHPPSQLRSALSAAANNTPLSTILDQHLSSQNTTRLIARTRFSNSTPQATQSTSSTAQLSPLTSIYDDADLYALLLRDLVQRRMGDAAPAYNDPTAAWPAHNAAKRPKRTVDTKASKGRRMRYAVHEKLRDFMVPEDRGRWAERQVDELFGTLLGRKRGALLQEDAEGDEDGAEEEALMLFRR